MKKFYKKGKAIGSLTKKMIGALCLATLFAGGVAAQNSCTIENMQEGVASGSLQLFATPGNGIATLFDPAGTGEPGDPGCFYSTAYPYNVDSVGLSLLDAAGFGLTGLGTYEFEVKIYDAVTVADCDSLGDVLFTSSTVTVEMDDTGFHNETVAVDINVDGPFYVSVETVSWSGSATASPSATVWDGVENNSCHQYVISGGGTTALDFQNYFEQGLTGWTNVVVYGTSPAQPGDNDYAVTEVSADDTLFYGTSETVTVSVSNTGTNDVANGMITLFENGSEVASGTITLAAGASGTVDISYVPLNLGTMELVATAMLDADVDVANDSDTTSVEVVMPPSDCVIEMEDFEAYVADSTIGTQSDIWSTWTGNVGGAEDLLVTTDQARSGSNSLEVTGTTTDVVLLLGNQVSGVYKLDMWMYVPVGSSGYFNIQNDEDTPGDEWAFEANLNADGSGDFAVEGVVHDFAYPQGEWFLVSSVIDVSNSVANFYVDETWVTQWDYSVSADAEGAVTMIGSVNFFAAGGTGDTDLFYVDDISFCPFFNNDACSAFQVMEGVTIQGDNTTATANAGGITGSCWGESTPTVGADVWYTFVAEEDGDYFVTTNLDSLGNTDTQIAVYVGDSCDGELTEIACNEDSQPSYLSSVAVEGLTAGDTIYIQVDGYDYSSGPATGTFEFLVDLMFNVNDECADAIDLNDLVGGESGVTMTSDITTNTYATTNDNDPTEGWDCFGEADGGAAAPSLESTVWYTFTGDGNAYYIETTDCDGNADPYITFGDTQLAIYSGECGSLTAVACNEDADETPEGEYPAGLTFPTEEGVTYYMMVDGYEGLSGQFCITFTSTVGIEENEAIGYEIFPNPNSGEFTITADKNIQGVLVYNVLGKEVKRIETSVTNQTRVNMNNLDNGVYFVRINVDGKEYTQKIVKN